MHPAQGETPPLPNSPRCTLPSATPLLPSPPDASYSRRLHLSPTPPGAPPPSRPHLPNTSRCTPRLPPASRCATPNVSRAADFPAWRVARAVTLAELRGAALIAGLQVEHSLVQRTTEHELLPAAHALGLGIVAWSPLGGGLLTGKYRQGEQGPKQCTAVLDTLIAVAQDAGVTPAEIAIAWVAAKGSLPIIGPRSLSQLQNNLSALRPHANRRLSKASTQPVIPN